MFLTEFHVFLQVIGQTNYLIQNIDTLQRKTAGNYLSKKNKYPAVQQMRRRAHFRLFSTFLRKRDRRTNGRTDGRTDRRTDRRTDTPSYRDARRI